MLSMQVADIKNFMAHLLSKDSFDSFYLIEATIKMGVTYQIEGRLNKDFYDTDTEQGLNRDYCYWKEIRGRVFDMIKGKRLPLSCKIILGLPKPSLAWLIGHSGTSCRAEDVNGAFINILYDPKNLLVTTGISYSVFSLDKTLDYAFDDYAAAFLKKRGIC